MKSKSTITILLAFLMASSLFVVSTTPMTDTTNQRLEMPQATHNTAEAPGISTPHILVYTEFVDDRTGQEYENTMTAINNTYGTNYQQTNFTDYNTLDTHLPGKDILLIPEQELATPTTMKAVGAIWNASLRNFVDDGGVVILLDFGNVSNPGLGLHIYNQSGLMQFGPVMDQYPGGSMTTMRRAVFGDALCRRIEYSWAPRNNTLAVATTDGTIALDTYDPNYYPICVHKTLGRGHVVFLGFDMQDADSNYEQIVGNAVRLTNHVVFDSSQNQDFDFEVPPPTVGYHYELAAWVDDLVEDGFAVSRMDTFDPGLFNACEVLVLGPPELPHDYGASETAQIDAYVSNGGSIFIYSDWGSAGDDIEALANHFGYYWARDCLYDSDDNIGAVSQVIYTDDNILSHPITTDVQSVEFYAGDGLTDMPAGAEPLVFSDWDGTSTWRSDGTAAEGVVTMAVSRHGSGRIGVVLDSNFIDGTDIPSYETDSDSDGTVDYQDGNNSLLLMNTIRWLASGSANTPPTISSLDHSPLVPMNGITVTIVTNMVDPDGIDNATCFYRLNAGSWTSLTMTPDVGDDFIATIGSFEEKDDVDYYVRVFDNSSDSMETVSHIASFEVYNHLPDIPVLTDPGSLDDDGIFLLNWTESTDDDGYVDHYEIQMDDAGTFSVLLDHWTTTSNETWVNVFSNGTYYFRVKALDDHGEYAGFSNVVSIEVGIPTDVVAPVIATLFTDPVNPIHGDVVTVKADVLDFTGIDNVTCSYRVNSGSWTHVLMVNVFGDRYEVSIGSFDVDDVVYISVQAWDNSSAHNSRISAFSFVIENQAPLAPDLLDPGTTISVTHFIANWTAGSDHEGAIDHYQLQVSVSSEFATIFGEWNTTELSLNVTDLTNGVYYLRVRTVDDHDAVSPWSDVESIEVILSTTSSTPPSNPSPTATGPFDPDILNLVFLIVTVGSLAIILIVVVGIIKQRSRTRSQYKF